MRRVQRIVGLSLFMCFCAGHALGCFFTLDLDHLDCDLFSHAGCGGGGGTPAACIPSENSKPVDESCGVFVSSSRGADGAAGTKSAPLKTLQKAIEKANGRAVYACAEAFAGSVTLASGSAIFGGLDCLKDWSYVGTITKSALTGDADAVAMTIASTANGATVEDFTITAANAMTAGASSIAVLVNQATASLTRCDLIAGDGAAGAAGTDAPSMPAMAGANGSQGNAACSADMVAGGAQVKNVCGMETSVGGNGGNGNDVNGGAGSPGIPNNGGGQAGQGDDGTVGWSCNVNGGNGQPGAPGPSGMPGGGAAMSDLGTLASTGFTPASGGDGQLGKIGQGGGGGGGVKGGAACGAINTGGASGGSGGGGGCGGEGGKGGQGGGASIALVNLKASLTLTQVTLKTGTGGAGGKGGVGQAGGDPGAGGTGGTKVAGLQAGCDGGKGGPGGDGGTGGGGRGGHSIGVAYTGTVPAIDMKQVMLGSAGKGGPGGNNNLSMNQGADGLAAAMQAFP